MLTLVEYLLLLYRGLLPAPVWYRFFLNKEYGSIFSSLITGLYLTFKLTSIVEKVFSSLLRYPVYGFLSLFYLFYFILDSQWTNCAFLDVRNLTFHICFQVQSFVAAVKALSRKEVHYGSHATMEQVPFFFSSMIISQFVFLDFWI